MRIQRSVLLFFMVFHAALFCTHSLNAEEKNIPDKGRPVVLPDTLIVGLAGSSPFVTHTGGINGGISLDVWEQIAAMERLVYRLENYNSIGELISAAAAGEVHIGIGPITVTEERARQVTFTQPYYMANMGILTRAEKYSFWAAMRPFLSTAFLIAVGSLAVILFLVGNLVWLAEHRKNEHFPQTYFRGVGNGMWFAIVTFTTVGYGDLAPRTAPGRFIAGMWMIIAMVTASSITAGIATAFTLFTIDEPEIATPDDLRNVRVAVLADSPGRDFATRCGARLVQCSDVNEAGTKLLDGEVKAFVHDYPVLRHFSAVHHSGQELNLIESNRRTEHYGFCTAFDNSLFRRINLALLRAQEAGLVRQVLESYGF